MVSPDQNQSPIQATSEATAVGLVSGVHVVVVGTPQGNYRRRVYFNLLGAQKAADRAIMAGHSAHIILAQLVPVNPGENLE